MSAHGGPAQRQRAIALETQMLLEFKHLKELRPEDFGVDSPAQWLITITVEREIQRKKSTGDRLQRRARQVDKLLDEKTLPIRRFRPSRPIDYARYHLDPAHNDDKILGELIAFREQYPEVELRVVSDDGGFRRTAEDLGFAVIAPSENLRLAPDPLEQENAELRKRIAVLENARAKLELTTKQHPWTALICNPLEEEQLAEAVEAQIDRVAPAEDSPVFQALAKNMLGLLGTPNPKYDEQRSAYIEKFREYYQQRYRILRRSFDIEPQLSNDGDMQAEDIDIEILVPGSIGVAHEKGPTLPAFPKPPASHVSAISSNFAALARQENPLLGVTLFHGRTSSTPLDYGPLVSERDGSNVVRYRRSKLGQHRNVDLPAFYIVLQDSVRAGLQLEYELRSAAPGLKRGTIDIRFNIDTVPPPTTPIMHEDDFG